MPQQDKNWSRNVPKALSKQGCMEPEYCVGWSLTTSWSWAFGSRGRCAWGCCSTSSEEPQSGLTQGTDLRLWRYIWRSNLPCLDLNSIEFWIRVLNFGLIWIRVRIQGYFINFERKINKKNFREKQLSHKIFWSVESLNGEFNQFTSKILHLLLLIYPIFTSVDPDPHSEYGSVSTKFLNTDPIWIRIHNTKRTCWDALRS